MKKNRKNPCTYPSLRVKKMGGTQNQSCITKFLNSSDLICTGAVATSPVVLCWLCDSPQTGCVWRTTPYIYVAWTSNNRVHMPWSLSAYASCYVQTFTRSYHQRLHATITLLLLVRAIYMYGVVLHAHPVRGESHNQRNTTGEVPT